MHASGLFLLAVPLLGSGAKVDVAAGGTVQVRVGLLPVPNQQSAPEPGENQQFRSEPGTETIVTPVVGIRRSSDRSTMGLTYLPRFYLRLPSIVEQNSVLVFNTAQANYSRRLTRRLSCTAGADLGIGELNYTDLELVFDPGSSAPSEQIVPTFRVNGNGRLSYLASPQHASSVDVRGGYREFLPSTTTTTFTPSANVSATLQHAFHPNSRQVVSAAATIGLIESSGRNTSTLTGSLGLGQQLSGDSSLRLDAGLNYAWQNDAPDSSRAFPSGTLAHSTAWRGSGLNWNMTSSGGVNAFFDELEADYRPQLNLNWNLGMRSGQKWTSGLSATLSVPVSARPTSPDRLESVATILIPFAYPLSDSFKLSFDSRARFRAPHPAAFDQGEVQTEVSGTVTLSYGTGTGPTRGAWL